MQASSLRGTTRVRSLLLGARRLHDLDTAKDEALLLTRSRSLQVTLMLLSVHVDPLRATGRHLTIGAVRGGSLREVLAGGDGAGAAIVCTARSVRVRLFAVTILRSHEVRLRVLLAVD